MLSKAACRFDQLSKNIAASEVHRSSISIEILARILRKGPPANVLDIGCATGHFSRSVSPPGSLIVGIDPSRAMLEHFEATGAGDSMNVEARQGRAESLPAQNGEFDLVLTRLAAHHFEEIECALGEFCRVTKPGGLVAVVDLEGSDETGPDDLLHSIELLHDPSHIRSYSSSKWRSMLEAVDLDIIESRQALREAPDGISVSRWCEIAGSGAIAEAAINQLLHSADPTYRAALGITRGPNGFIYPVRTCLFLARRRIYS